MSDTKKVAAKPKAPGKDLKDLQEPSSVESADECQIGADLSTLRREQKQIAAKIRGK